MFNMIKYTQELEEAGFTREQAETSVKLLIDVMNENFATKSDLKETEMRLSASIHAVETKLDSSEMRMNASMRELEYKLIIKLGTLFTIAIGVCATLMKTLSRS